MPKVNRKPGIHLHKTTPARAERRSKHGVTYGPPVPPEYYWILIAKNGKTIAKSSETYKRKSGAVGSIRVAAKVFRASFGMFGGHFFDHTGKNGSKVDAYNF